MHCTKDEFAKIAIRTVSELGYCRVTGYDPDKFAVGFKRRNGESGMLYLSNVYQLYCAASEAEQLSTLRSFCVNLFESESTATQVEEAAPRLFPFFKPRFTIEKLHLELALGEHYFANATPEQRVTWRIPYMPIAEHYALGLVYDKVRTEALVRQDILTAWNMSFEEGLDLAFANLRESAQHPFELAAPGVFTGPARADYNPAKLLLTDKLNELPLKGRPVAIVPHVNQFLIAGSDDVAGLKTLLAMAMDLINGPHGMLSLPIVFDNGVWAPFSVDGNHELFGDFDGLRLSAMSVMYGEQKILLDRLHAQTGEDIFVASYQGFKADNLVFSQAVLTEGAVPALLPLADRFEFGRIEAETNQWTTLAAARLDKCLGAVADLLIPMGMYPERCRIDAFPSKRQINQIGQEPFKAQFVGFVAPQDDPRKIIEEVLSLPVYPNARPVGDSKERQNTFSMDFASADSVQDVSNFYFSALNKKVSFTFFNLGLSQYKVADALKETVEQQLDQMLKEHFKGRGPRGNSDRMPTPDTFQIVEETQAASLMVSMTRGQGNGCVLTLTKRTYSGEAALVRSIIPVAEAASLEKMLGITVHPHAIADGAFLKDSNSASQLFAIKGAHIDEVTKFYLAGLKQGSYLSYAEHNLIEAIGRSESISVQVGRGAARDVYMLVSRRMLGSVKPAETDSRKLFDLEQQLDIEIYPNASPHEKLSKKKGAIEQRFTTGDTAQAVARFYRFVLQNPIHLPLPGSDPQCTFICSLTERRRHAVLVMGGPRTQFVVRSLR